MQPRLDRLDPFRGIQKLFTTRSAVELLKSGLKVVLVSWAGYGYLSSHWEEFYRLSAVAPTDIGPRVGGMAYGLAIRMLATLFLLAAVDYCWQRWSFEKQIRMTKQEVKDEFRDSEGNPQTKMRMRLRQRQLSRRRMMASVPKAKVVIMNPTHYAMALQYEMGQKGAPIVLAKGMDLIALRIRDIAEANGVPVVVNPPLARALYQVSDVGEEIPQDLYQAVAEVLAVVLHLDESRRPVATNA
jgi:flagellar biosynthetic protein FlhB